MHESRFWSTYYELPKPADFALERVPASEAVGFVKGARAVYNVVEALDPDVLFLPLRGADPIDWALQELAVIYNGKERERIYLPIGTAVDPKTNVEFGPDKPTKRQVVRRLIDDLRAKKGWYERPLLIDEVQSGATIRDVVKILGPAMLGNNGTVPLTDVLYVVAIQDSRNQWLARNKAKGFTSIIRNGKTNIRGFVQEVPLFTVDRQVFLSHLLVEQFSNQARTPMIVQNIEAQKLIRGLVRLLHSSTPEEELKGILKEKNPPGMEEWYREVLRLSVAG